MLANRLSADPATRVLLLEAGGKDDYFWIEIPVGYLYTIANPRTDWCYKTEPEPASNGRSIDYARGKVLGGCSSINAMIYMRGQKEDYDHWAALGNRGWSWDEVLPVLQALEDYEHGADELTAPAASCASRSRACSWEILDAWRDAADECGIPKIAEFNRGDNFGNAYFQMNQRRGGAGARPRRSCGRCCIGRTSPCSPTRTSQRVIVEARDGARRATGVEIRRADGRRRSRARRAARSMLAAGAIGSPQLLQLSGIGPGALLQRARHPGRPRAARRGREPARPSAGPHAVQGAERRHAERRANSLLGKAAMGLEYFLFRTGPLTMPPSQLGRLREERSGAADARTSSGTCSRSRSTSSAIRCTLPGDHAARLQPAADEPRATCASRARIPLAHPAIRLNYLATAEDQRVAVDGMRFTRRIMAAQALAKYAPEEWRPGAAVESDADLLHAAGDLGTTIFHPVGTCRMGPDPHGGRRRPAAGARRRTAAGHRRVRHAAHHVGQHQCAHRDDRREGRRDDPGRHPRSRLGRRPAARRVRRSIVRRPRQERGNFLPVPVVPDFLPPGWFPEEAVHRATAGGHEPVAVARGRRRPVSQSIGPDGPCVVSAGAMKYVASFLNSAVPSARAIQSSKFVWRM